MQPWEEHRVVDLREQFVLEVKAPSGNLSESCRRYKISRKTGYKWLRRFDEQGVEGLRDMSRRPHRLTTTSGEQVLLIAEARRAHPTWGSRKLRSWLTRRCGGTVPTTRTIDRVLERLGLRDPTQRRRPRRVPSARRAPPRTDVRACNDEWTADFKGWWKTRGGARVEPLTVRDAFSRYVLTVKVVESTTFDAVRREFKRIFDRYGLPKRIRVDNGQPFASTTSRGGLTKLSAWWVSLGITLVRGRPGHPQDNGAHERMHADMARELEKSPAATKPAQQRQCDAWRRIFNDERPHDALGLRTPGEVYRRSPRPYRGPKLPKGRGLLRSVSGKGQICLRGRVVFVSESLAGQKIHLEHVEPTKMRIWFYGHDLGLLDLPRRAA
jgi:transposase InsO family protein